MLKLENLAGSQSHESKLGSVSSLLLVAYRFILILSEKVQIPPHLSAYRISPDGIRIISTNAQGSGATSEIRLGILNLSTKVAVKKFRTSKNMDAELFSNVSLSTSTYLAVT